MRAQIRLTDGRCHGNGTLNIKINGRCHVNHIMADMSETRWDGTALVSSKSVILDHPLCQSCGPFTWSKFGVDPIFAVGDIAILWFCQFGWKMSNHAHFLRVSGGLNPLEW